jgi:hypothetical protein
VEIERRTNLQWSVFALQLASVGAITSVTILALLAALGAAMFLWSVNVSGWPVIPGGAAGWVLGVAVTADLHRSFARASDV